MSKGQADRRQREFLFVLNSKAARNQVIAKSKATERAACANQASFKSEETKEARKKLIAELREFGC